MFEDIAYTAASRVVDLEPGFICHIARLAIRVDHAVPLLKHHCWLVLPRCYLLRSWLLLLLLPQRTQTNTRDLDDLESHTRNITLGLSLSTESGEKDLIVLVDEVEATVVGDCGGVC